MNYTETPFTAYALNQEEHMQGLVLNVYQKAVLQNQVSEVAQQLITMKMDIANPMQFALDQAALQGQMETLRNILERSSEAEKLLAELSNPR